MMWNWLVVTRWERSVNLLMCNFRPVAGRIKMLVQNFTLFEERIVLDACRHGGLAGGHGLMGLIRSLARARAGGWGL